MTEAPITGSATLKLSCMLYRAPTNLPLAVAVARNR